MNDNNTIVLTAQKTVIVFKLFSLLSMLIEKSAKKNVRKILIENFQEEFKYYFNEDRIRLKTYNYYPIIGDLQLVINKLQIYII
jgi:hypothetical protein